MTGPRSLPSGGAEGWALIILITFVPVAWALALGAVAHRFFSWWSRRSNKET